MSKWNLSNVGDLTRKIVLITGCTSGMGYEATKFLGSKNAFVIMACLNYERGNIAKEKILKEVPNAKLDVFEVDVSNLDSVRNFVDELKKKYTKIDILINNAGIQKKNYEESKQGYELTFATNYLGHFLLTALLLDIINKSDDGRIVMYSSNGHSMGDGHFLVNKNEEYKGMKVYGESKLACLMFGYKLDKELKKKNIKIKVTSVHPGWIVSNLERDHNVGKWYKVFVRIVGMPTSKGIMAAIYGATENIKGGEYIAPDGKMQFKGHPKITKSSSISYDEKLQNELWDMSQKLTNIDMEGILKNVKYENGR